MPIVAALVPTIIGASITGSIVFSLTRWPIGAALLIGFNGDMNKKGVLLFGVYLIGTFGSALSIVYAWNASNVSHICVTPATVLICALL